MYVPAAHDALPEQMTVHGSPALQTRVLSLQLSEPAQLRVQVAPGLGALVGHLQVLAPLQVTVWEGRGGTVPYNTSNDK